MIAYALASLREWRVARMRRTVSAAALMLAAAALAGPLQPLILAIATTAVFALSGWADGNGPKPARGDGIDPLVFPSRAGAIVSGRILAALASWLALCLALSPVLAASAIAWGLSSATILSCLLCWLTAYLVGASAGFCSMLAFSGSDGFVGLLIYLGWILSSFFAAPFKFSNPFIQAWSLLRLEGGSAPYSGILAEAIVAAGLFAASALVLSARRRKRDA